MQVIIGSEIRIKDAPKILQNWCSENLVIPNPEYANRARRGLWTGSTPQHLWLYWVDGSDLVLPVGVGKEIRALLPAECEYITDLADNGKLQYAGVFRCMITRRRQWRQCGKQAAESCRARVAPVRHRWELLWRLPLGGRRSGLHTLRIC